MFQKILVPVDLTQTHGRSLEIAAELAGAGRGEVTLLHVIELIAGMEVEEEKEFYGRLEQAADEHMRRLGQVLGAKKGQWGARVRYGNRAQEIVRHAVESATDLIVLTSHKIDPGQPGGGWGTLSYKVGILSPCPVLLVK